MNIDDLEVGVRVAVDDSGLAMIRKIAGEGAPPNNIGVIHEVLENGMALVSFSLEKNEPGDHSQIAPYHFTEMTLQKGEGR